MPAEEFFAYYSNAFGDRWGCSARRLGGEPVYKTLKFEGAEPYYLDEVSWFAAKSLGVEPGWMCSIRAPLLAERRRARRDVCRNGSLQ